LVIDFNPTVMRELSRKNIKCVYGDIAHADTLRHAGVEHAELVVSSITDDVLRGTSNLRLMSSVHMQAPNARVVLTTDHIPQALHPMAMAGVAEPGNWRQDPFGRVAATSGYVLTTTYGDTESALAAAAWVRKIHVHERGVDPETKLPYSAEDPSLLLWVHAGMVESIVTVVQRYGRVLDAGDADRYVAEMVRFAEIVGVPAEQVPSSVASVRTYIESVELRQATPAARDAIGVVLDPPDLDAEMRDLWH